MQHDLSEDVATPHVLLEDNHLLVVDKPAGLLTQPSRSGDDSVLGRAKAYLKRRYNKPGNVYLGLVHRLDRNVSGVVVLARTSKAASRLSKQFASRQVDKRYLALVAGDAPDEASLTHHLRPRLGERGMEVHVEGKRAELRYTTLAREGVFALLEVTLLTGRKHQIRLQLATHGVPIVGDPLYGSRARAISRPALHARRLTFSHPVGGADICVTAEVPEDLKALVQLRGLGNAALG